MLKVVKSFTYQTEPSCLTLVKRRHETTTVLSPSSNSDESTKYNDDIDDSSAAACNDHIGEEDLNFEWESNLSQSQREKFAQIKMEYVIWVNADDFIATPEMISESNWMTILAEPNAEARLRTYMFLNRRARYKIKSKEKQAVSKQSADDLLAKRIELRESGQLDYGFFGGNFMMQRVKHSSVMKWRTDRVPNTYQLNPPLIMDLSLFRYLDCSRDVNLTAKQIKLCNALNFGHRLPFHLIYTGYDPSANWADALNKQFYPDGINAFPVMITEKSYMDLYPHEKLVYLSPDAPETLREFDSDSVYIIGAMVDKTPLRKNLTYGIAKRLGIRSQRLPLEEHLRWRMGKKTLSLNHVLGALLDVHMTNDWRSALLASVPARNLKDRTRTKIEKNKENNEMFRARFNALLSLTCLET